MKTREQRDDEAVTIAVGLLLFVLVTAAGGVALALAHHVVAIDGELLRVLIALLLACAAGVTVRYIHRHRAG